jgi:DNA-binding response OmpR family regulator
MVIAWITTRTEPSEIERFPASQWEIKVFKPVEFVSTNLPWPGNPDVIVMEVMDRPLIDVCQEICQARIAPVLAIVPDLAYAQAALESGADDFVVTPVNAIEAILRVRKLLRASSSVRVGYLQIDLAAWRVTNHARRVQLSPIEFRLPACLAKRVGQMVNHATILQEVWGWDVEPAASVQVKSYIGRVRRKIEPDPRNPQYIVSIAGEGYRLRNQKQWIENQNQLEGANTTH